MNTVDRKITSSSEKIACSFFCNSGSVSVRDFVITEIALSNASRSGAITNMTLAEYTAAGIESNQHVVSVAQHKTAHCYGPAKICLSATHFAWLRCYISVFRKDVCHEDSGSVFLKKWNGCRCPVNRCTCN